MSDHASEASMTPSKAREYLDTVKGTEGLYSVRPEIMERLRYEGFLAGVAHQKGKAEKILEILDRVHDGICVRSGIPPSKCNTCITIAEYEKGE